MHNIDLSNIVKKNQVECPCCSSPTEVVFELPDYPITELYRSIDDNNKPYGFINQSARFCSNCSHFFLEKILDPDVIYSDKNYITSTVSSKGATDCLDEFYEFICENSDKKEFIEKTIIDIGGNDSYFLKKFVNNSNKLINIDPHASSDCNEIELKNSFFEFLDFKEFKTKEKCIFVSSHTFEHLENPVSVLINLSKIVKKEDELYLQFPSIEKLVEFSRFDQICHQHINLFSINSVSSILEKEGLFLNAYEFDTFHFGTIRLKFSRNKNLETDRKLVDVISLKNSYNYFETFYETLNSLIGDKFIDGQGFGAGLMVPTLSYHLPCIDKLHRIIDENPDRIGKKFINLTPKILGPESFDLSEPILITSISTKAAARAIFSKLDKLGFKDICLPLIST